MTGEPLEFTRTPRGAAAIAHVLAHHAVIDLVHCMAGVPPRSLPARETDLPGLLCSMVAGEKVVSVDGRLSITAANHAWRVQSDDGEIQTACNAAAKLVAAPAPQRPPPAA